MSADAPCVKCGHSADQHTYPDKGDRYDGKGCHGSFGYRYGSLGPPPTIKERCFCPMFVPPELAR